MNASNNGNGSSTQEYQIVFGVFQGSDEDWIPAYLKVDGWLFWTLVVIGYTSYQSFIKFFAPWYWPHYNPLAKSKQADNWGFPLTWQLRTENPLDIANWTDPTRNDPLNQMTVVRAERQDKPPCDCQIGRRYLEDHGLMQDRKYQLGKLIQKQRKAERMKKTSTKKSLTKKTLAKKPSTKKPKKASTKRTKKASAKKARVSSDSDSTT